MPCCFSCNINWDIVFSLEDEIDFISLDVEGYEISVLNGLDFKKFTPSFIMIETTTYEERKNSSN